ncbi:MAG: DUF4180 domain-containing protein [Spirochaetales bacterium]|nr:DUF4180 domain-containing protein [Spirochaetales bacterium]
MRIINHGRVIVELVTDKIIVNDVSDWSDLIVTSDQSAVIIKRHNLNDNFFDLKTKFAGEILQKFSTYNKRLAITGDFSDIKSKSFRDFLYESNNGKQIIFVKDASAALATFLE